LASPTPMAMGTSAKLNTLRGLKGD
jgi:hypothetical protein